MTAPRRLAAIQMTSTSDVDRNLDTALGLAARAVSDGARLVVLPECFAHYGPGDSKLQVAEPLPTGGPIVRRCQDFCTEHKAELIVGGFWETPASHELVGKKVFNSSVHLGADGEVRAIYRKIHLFDVDLPDGSSIRESDTMLPGDAGQAVTTHTAVGKVGLSICYDVRFPELYRKLVDQGATVLTVPAAFALMTGKDHWHLLLRARAVESQCYVAAAAQTGLHFDERRSYGHALICDPWGTVLSECGEGDGYAIASIDDAYLRKVRASVPSLKHRRL